jgi:hypothetical protein
MAVVGKVERSLKEVMEVNIIVVIVQEPMEL